ncbi:STAS domain-containing protein [Herbidospora cretacea]|uniref:STAS domain-containing protein n=1 Tax=Herbidospora cretacea TaxID=28444 RepID=UPI0004C3F122|nr:STAS domain-containing protein [Herbidospora cretacea]
MDIRAFLEHHDESMRITPLTAGSGVRVDGELDYRGMVAVMAALTAVRRDDGPPCLDLGGISFIDVESLRTLESAQRNGRAQIVSVSGWLHRVLVRTGWPKFGPYTVDMGANDTHVEESMAP